MPRQNTLIIFSFLSLWCFLSFRTTQSLPTWFYHVLIEDFEKTEREFVYDLKTSSDQFTVILDCGSFIQGLQIEKQEEDEADPKQVLFKVLSEQSCMALAKKLFDQTHFTPKCLEISMGDDELVFVSDRDSDHLSDHSSEDDADIDHC